MMQKLPNSLYLGHASYVCSTVSKCCFEIKIFAYVQGLVLPPDVDALIPLYNNAIVLIF